MKNKKKVVGVGVFDIGLFLLSDNIECDFCDEMKTCASINCITGDVICVCKDCLQEFLQYFDKEE